MTRTRGDPVPVRIAAKDQLAALLDAHWSSAKELLHQARPAISLALLTTTHDHYSRYGIQRRTRTRIEPNGQPSCAFFSFTPACDGHRTKRTDAELVTLTVTQALLRDASTLAATTQQLSTGLAITVAKVALRLGEPLRSWAACTVGFILIVLTALIATAGALRLHRNAGNAVRTPGTRASATSTTELG